MWNITLKKLWAVVLVILLAVTGYCVWQNNDLTVSRSELVSRRVPEGFDGYTIVQISDLHNKEFGSRQKRLLGAVASQNPDLIVITGDMIDSRNTDVDIALELARQVVELGPCYYVTGNHESRVTEEYKELKAGLEDCGVIVLENDKVRLQAGDGQWAGHETGRDEGAITLIGVQDPAFSAAYLQGDETAVMEGQLETLTEENDGFTVLLSHRPELFDVYVSAGMNLVFSGHAHGGQWRLPGVGGLVAPGQGFFPKYTAGAYSAAAGSTETTMYVSRGLGNSLIPVRIFNRPEIVVVELKHIN